MTRMLFRSLLALTLLFSQHAAQLHWVEHLRGVPGMASKGTSPAGHPVEKCLAFHAIDGVMPGMAIPEIGCFRVSNVVALAPLPLPFVLRFAFDSRAPPVLS